MTEFRTTGRLQRDFIIQYESTDEAFREAENINIRLDTFSHDVTDFFMIDIYDRQKCEKNYILIYQKWPNQLKPERIVQTLK